MKMIQSKYINSGKWISGILFLLSIITCSCNNDFLDTQIPSNRVAGDSIMVLSDAGSFNYEFDMRSADGNWQLLQFPRWLEVSLKEGILNGNSKVNLQLTVNKQEIYVDLGLYSFPLIFNVDNVGLIENTVVLANVGEPEIKNTPSEITADYTFKGQYQIVNSGHGILIWKVVNKPEWLQLNVTEGILNSHESGIWNYSIDVTGLKPGDYSGQVEIQSNAGNQNFIINFHFTIQETGYYGGYLTGNFIDAKFSKTLNQIIVLTKDPNNLLFFKADSPHADTLKLNNIPQCLALSEDEKTLAIGFSNAEITTFETTTHTYLTTYPVNAAPNRIEFGKQNWLYFLAPPGYNTYLYSLNTVDGTVKKASNSADGHLPLKKVPGKDLLISTRPGWSPDGLFIYDISEGATVDSLNEYWMSLNGFWLSDDGERLFTGSQMVYQIPEYIPGQLWTMGTPQVLDEFNIGENLKINTMAHQSSSGRLFIAYEESYYRNTTYIKQLDDQTFATKKTYEATPTPAPDFPPGNTWWTVTSKIFPTPDGSELWIIRQYPASNYELPDLWTIERMGIN